MKLTAVYVALTLACGLLQAQTLYKITGLDGKVTFSDVPPADAKAVVPMAANGSEASALASLPLALRQVVAKYPVVLYGGPDCEPCGLGRNMLNARGVPFNEKTVASNDDIAALKRLSGEQSLPLLTIGSQQLKGFSDGNWAQYLDAAGYPQRSQLPMGYRNPGPSPLTQSKAEAADAAGGATPPAAAPRTPRAPRPSQYVPPAPNTDNPAGIRF